MFFFARYESRDLILSELKGGTANIGAGVHLDQGFPGLHARANVTADSQRRKADIHQRQAWVRLRSSVCIREDSRAICSGAAHSLASTFRFREIPLLKTGPISESGPRLAFAWPKMGGSLTGVQ